MHLCKRNEYEADINSKVGEIVKYQRFSEDQTYNQAKNLLKAQTMAQAFSRITSSSKSSVSYTFSDQNLKKIKFKGVEFRKVRQNPS